MMQVQSIFSYTDYRSFLKSYAEKRKKEKPTWTYGSWAHTLGLKATTSLTMILNGQRDPGESISQKLAAYFKFNQKEEEYFLDLIRLKKVRDSRLRILLMEEMKKLAPDGKFVLLDDRIFSAISKWYFYAIRQMTKLKEFRDDPSWINKQLKFKLTEKQISKAIQILLELKLLERDKNKKLTAAKASLKSTDDVSSEGLKRFHEQMIEHAKESIRSIPLEKRDITGLTLTIQKEKLEKAKNLIREFLFKFDDVIGADEGDATYQLNVQFFPLAELSPKDKGENHET